MLRPSDLQALIIATVAPHSGADAEMTDIGAALAALGVPTRTVLHASDHPNPDLMKALVRSLREGGLAGFMVKDGAGDLLMAGHDRERPVTIHDAWGLPLVALLTGHPAGQFEALARAPENALVAVSDQGHLAFLEQAGLPPRSHLFCPPGGPEPVPQGRGARERSIDLLFVGDVAVPEPAARWLDRLVGGRNPQRPALAEALAAVREEGREAFAAVTGAFGRRGLDARPSALAGLVAAVDARAAGLRRLEVLRAVRSRVVVVGEVAPAAGLDHHDLRGPASFARTLSLMADARVLIDSHGTLGRGASPGVFYGLSRGAVVACEPSRFLAEEQERELGLVALPGTAADIDRRLTALSTGPDALDALDAIRERGLPIYAARHTWKRRMALVLTALATHAKAARRKEEGRG